MNKIKTIVCVVILYTLVTVAIIGICSEPAEENWLQSFIISKGIGFGAAFLTYVLAREWKDDNTVKKINQFCKE